MTILEAQDILDNEISYKNASFYIRQDTYDDFIHIRGKFLVKDACSGYKYDTSPEIPLTNIETLEHKYFKSLNKEHFVEIIYQMCKRLEMHEIQEHFKVNNKCLHEPHPERIKEVFKPLDIFP